MSEHEASVGNSSELGEGSNTRLADGVDPRNLRRLVFGAMVGTALEWYDFFIYGTAAALVFNQLFFPGFSDAAGILASFAAFGVGFLVRPLGGIIFGMLGDRIGRRETLIITTLIMGLSTGVIGLLPTYETIGVLAPAVLVFLRVCQGLGAGAEFGGASTLLAESSPSSRRGFFCSFSQMGVQVGLVLGNVAFLIVALLPDPQLFSWGWRIPFLISFAMIAVALYVRLRVEESPVFQAMTQNTETVRLPMFDAVRRHPRNFLVGIGAHVCDTGLAYFFATYSVVYLTTQVGVSRNIALAGVIIYGLVVIVLQPMYGALSDRIGRRPINIFSVVFTALFAFPFFLLLGTGSTPLIWGALIIATALGWAPMIAVQGAFYSELFGARVRYTGFAASREIGAALAGFTPFIAGVLVAALNGAPWLAAAFIIVLALISLTAFLFSRETKNIDVTEIDPVDA